MPEMIGQHDEPVLALIATAREKGLWFFLDGEYWCDPDQIEAEYAVGDFIYIPQYVKLRDPRERIGELAENVVKAEREYAEFCVRVARPVSPPSVPSG